MSDNDSLQSNIVVSEGGGVTRAVVLLNCCARQKGSATFLRLPCMQNSANSPERAHWQMACTDRPAWHRANHKWEGRAGNTNRGLLFLVQ